MQPMKASCHDTDHLPILSVSRHENRVFGPETLRDTYESAHLSVSWQAGMILRPRQRCGAPVTARKMTTGETATGRGEHSLPEILPPAKRLSKG